jgi:hypothetical protein
MSTQRASVLAVFPNQQGARRAAEDARRAGVADGAIRIGEALDRVTALRAEMLDEVETTTMAPGNVGPFTKEQRRAMVPLTIGLAALGMLVALPFAFIEFFGLDAWARVLILLFVGGSVGALLGFQFGGMYGARRPEERLAAEEGVTVVVDDASDDVIDVLRAHRPMKLDAIGSDGRPMHAIDLRDRSTSPKDMAQGVAEDVARNMRDRDLEG